MGFQLYITRLKCLFRNKEAMFWCYLFPILLATCFFFAFNNLWKIEDFKTILIAYVSAATEGDELKQVLEEAKTSNGVMMFDITDCNKAEAQKLLEEKRIEAYIEGGADPVLTVKESGMNQTIIKSFLDSYRQMSTTVMQVMSENPKVSHAELLEDVMQYNSYVQELTNDKKSADLLIYFYSLLAFACIFAANWGLDEMVNIQANLSGRGARVSVAPIHKMKLFICNMLAAFTAHIGSLFLLFLYMYYVIKIDFGHNLFYLLLLCIVGSLAGLGLGGTIGVWIKQKAEVKEAVLSVITLGGAFLSGMMFPNIKYLIGEKLPLLAHINPVNLITDGMYSLYYFDTYDRFFMNVFYLCGITVVFGVASYIGIRRKNYASI